jgi:hypothetical protein
MFEKEAEEYRKDLKSKFFLSEPQLDLACQGFKDGYDKANEWHYVKDGDLPKDNKEYLVLYYYNYRGKKEIHCGVRDNLCNDFEINRGYTEQIIAWKEIVLPKESE